MEIITATESPPWLCLIYGPPGVGKSTLCKHAPKPVFVDLENGVSRLGVARTPVLKELSQVYTAIKELSQSEFQTVVFDTIDVIEQMVIQETCRTNGWKSLEQPGYGKGQTMAAENFQTFLRGVDVLRNAGKNVILIGHSQITRFEDPTGDGYDQISIKANKRIASNILATMDAVLYADVIIERQKNSDKKVKASSTGERIIRTTPGGAYVAKNRFNLEPEEQLTPELWSKFV